MYDDSEVVRVDHSARYLGHDDQFPTGWDREDPLASPLTLDPAPGLCSHRVDGPRHDPSNPLRPFVATCDECGWRIRSGHHEVVAQAVDNYRVAPHPRGAW